MGGAGATGYEKLRRLVLSVDVSLGATAGEEEDVVAFVGGDSAGEDEGMRL